MKHLIQRRNLKVFVPALIFAFSASAHSVSAQEEVAPETQEQVREQVMNLDNLEVRDNLRYAPEQSAPFTGNAVSYFDDGLQKLQVSFKNGLKHGKEVAWYEDGQLRYVVRYLDGQPQSQGSTWYARSSQVKVAASVLRFCDEEEMNIGFCDPGVQESSRIEFTP